MRRSIYRGAALGLMALLTVGCGSTAGQGGGANASSLTYASPVALASGSQAPCSNLHYKSGSKARIAYKPRTGTHKLGDYVIKNVGSKSMKVGILEGAPGYHSTERVGGFEDAIKGHPNFQIVASLDGNWNVDGGNKAATDMLQAHPDVQMIFAANDYEILGAAKAAQAAGKSGLLS